MSKNKENMIDLDLSAGLNEEVLSTEIAEDLDESYRPVGTLYVPLEALNKFEMEGFELRWVRIHAAGTVSGELDTQNIQRKEAEGYEFVLRSEIPGLKKGMLGFFDDALNNKDHGLYVVGGMALAKISKGRVAKKRQYIAEITRERSRSIIRDLNKDSINPNQDLKEGNSKEEVTFGETKKARVSRSAKFGQ